MRNFYWLIQGDAFLVLPQIKHLDVDLVILDPPYLVAKRPDIRNDLSKTVEGFRASEWRSLFKLIYEILKDDRDLVIFGHLSTFLKIHQFIEMNKFNYITDLVWVKLNIVNFLQAKRKPLNRHEIITVWSKGKFRYNFRDAQYKSKPYNEKRNGVREGSLYNTNRIYIPKQNRELRFMSDVIVAPSKGQMQFNERTIHPTQKPESLISQLIKAFSFEGDIVLDPFLGSGTTMKVCQDLGRSCIGIEINPEYCEIIKKRCFGRQFLDRQVEYYFTREGEKINGLHY